MEIRDSDTPVWVPKVISEYEVGRAMSAIEAIELLDKPIAEVITRHAVLADLEDDLCHCLELAGNPSGVNFWTRPTGDGKKFRCGFYREAWTLKALDFLDRTELSQLDRAWISGLLFGYRPTAIQQFIMEKLG